MSLFGEVSEVTMSLHKDRSLDPIHMAVCFESFTSINFYQIRIRIRRDFIRHECLHKQGMYFGREVHTLNI